MTAPVHHYDCAALGICQQRKPACPGCSQSMAWREAAAGADPQPAEPAATNQPFWIDPSTTLVGNQPHLTIIDELPDEARHRAFQAIQASRVPRAPRLLAEPDATTSSWGWHVSRGLALAAFVGCALIGAGTVLGYAWERWLQAPALTAWHHLLALLP